MKQFITKKKIKIPRIKLYSGIFLLLIIAFFLFNIFLKLILNITDEDKFYQVLIDNSTGNISKSENGGNIIYKNMFGIFPKQLDKMVMKEEKIDLNPIIYIYNTYQTDQYKSGYFNRYNVIPYVVWASYILKENLSLNGIESYVEEEKIVKINQDENIPYSNSYKSSKLLLEKRTKEYPSLKYYFDLQVSDYERDITTAKIDDKTYAKILFVVGTDNPNYIANEKFASSLDTILKKKATALSRGISLRGGVGYQGVYNQDFSAYSLLIQVGGIYNTIDEVNRSIKVLADVLKIYLEENNEEK